MKFRELFHKLLGIPYKLSVTYDRGDPGLPTIIFLHGIASTSKVWQSLIGSIPEQQYRIVTLDLLGFGNSPKPKNIKYSVRDHAQAVSHTIKSLVPSGPVVLAGHSMGGLIAIEVATINPGLVQSLLLISPPLYNPEEILAATSKYGQTKRKFGNGLFIMYDQVIHNQKMTWRTAEVILKAIPKSTGFTLNKDTWEPFKLSLGNTIMRQTASRDLLKLEVPTHILYGKFDMLVQSKNYENLPSTNPNISVISYVGGHMISKKYIDQVLQIIKSSLTAEQNLPS